MNALGRRASSFLVGLATVIVIISVAVLPFVTPQWVALEQGRANATGWTGYSVEELRTATDSILSDLVLGPPAFNVQVRGEPVLDEREQGHMRDVRSVFVGLWVLTALSLLVLLGAGRRVDRPASWRAMRRGAFGLAVAVVLLGVIALVAFDALFEFFHRILFPAGSYTFDPATERLVQLFPFQFWEETAFVVGIVILAISMSLAAILGRASRGSRRIVGAELAANPEPVR